MLLLLRRNVHEHFCTAMIRVHIRTGERHGRLLLTSDFTVSEHGVGCVSIQSMVEHEAGAVLLKK